jgi:hypothetical protein
MRNMRVDLVSIIYVLWSTPFFIYCNIKFLSILLQELNHAPLMVLTMSFSAKELPFKTRTTPSILCFLALQMSKYYSIICFLSSFRSHGELWYTLWSNSNSTILIKREGKKEHGTIVLFTFNYLSEKSDQMIFIEKINSQQIYHSLGGWLVRFWPSQWHSGCYSIEMVTITSNIYCPWLYQIIDSTRPKCPTILQCRGHNKQEMNKIPALPFFPKQYHYHYFNVGSDSPNYSICLFCTNR